MRYAPHRELPPYAYVPGRDPHPTRDPDGHSYGHDETPPEPLPASSWRSNELYLFGVDLYNHGYLWEAHEAWETIWHGAKRHDALQATCLQGLIQCAAACLKIAMGQPRGLERLCALGTEKLDQVAAAGDDRPMGLDLREFVEAMRAFAAGAPDSAEGRPRIVLVD